MVIYQVAFISNVWQLKHKTTKLLAEGHCFGHFVGSDSLFGAFLRHMVCPGYK